MSTQEKKIPLTVREGKGHDDHEQNEKNFQIHVSKVILNLSKSELTV